MYGGVLATGSGISRLEPGRVSLGDRDIAGLPEHVDVDGAAQVEQLPAGSGRPGLAPDGIVARCARAMDRMTVDSRPPDRGTDAFHRPLER
jgi:hypothetical protein